MTETVSGMSEPKYMRRRPPARAILTFLSNVLSDIRDILLYGRPRVKKRKL